MTPQEAIRKLRRLQYLRGQVVLTSMTEELLWARDRAVRHYMYPQAPASVPARPHKLTHRSGRLGRSTKVNPPRAFGTNVIGGLITGGPTAPYGPLHETGGTVSARPSLNLTGNRLSWGGPRGPGRTIPARPRIRPSLEDAMPRLRRSIGRGCVSAQASVGL